MQGYIFGARAPVFGHLLSAPESSPTFLCGNEHGGSPKHLSRSFPQLAEVVPWDLFNLLQSLVVPHRTMDSGLRAGWIG